MTSHKFNKLILEIMSVTKGVIHQIVELNERPIKVIVQVSPIVSKIRIEINNRL